MPTTSVLHLSPDSQSLRLMRVYGDTFDGLPVPNLDAALHWARQWGGGSIWIHASALPALGLPYQLPSHANPAEMATEGSGWGPWPAIADISPESVAPWGVAHRKPKVDIAVPVWNRERDVSLISLSPLELARTLNLYETSLGIRYRWTPGSTGVRLMGLPYHGRKFVDPSCSDLPEPARAPSTAQDMRRFRPLTDEEAAGGVVLAIDQTSRYLSTCSSVELGLGEPAWIDGRDLHPDMLNFPGYWHVADGWSDLSMGDVFAAWPFPRRNPGREEWWTTPQVKLWAEMSPAKPLHWFDGAHVWPKHARYLRPFYTRMRSAMNNANVNHDDALRALLKRTYTESIGLLGSRSRDRSPMFRPDWRHHIVSLSAVNTWRAMDRLMRDEACLEPFAVDVDCFYIALPHNVDWYEPKAKGWRIVGKTPVGDVADCEGLSDLRDVFDEVSV